MLARRSQADQFAEWNRRWGAPFGFEGHAELSKPGCLTESVARRVGCFGAQPNSSTRRVEFPWAFHAVPLQAGMRVVDVGGGMSGLQFVLDISGLTVVNVDPFLHYGSSRTTWPDPLVVHAKLNHFFGTTVSLMRTRLPQAELPSSSFDVVYCVSTLEHLDAVETDAIIAEAMRILRPGGHLVLTVDLFLNIVPFTHQVKNEWGRNINVADLVANSGMKMVHGVKQEIYGFDSFSVTAILARLEYYELHESYPQLAQMIVLQRLRYRNSVPRKLISRFSSKYWLAASEGELKESRGGRKVSPSLV